MKSTSRPVKKKQSNTMSATYWLIGIVAVMVGLALIVVVGQPQVGAQRAQAYGNTLGDPNAPVTVEEYADFQCPACGQFARQTLPQIEEKYIKTGKVKWVFNHDTIVGNESIRAAEASECANAQGKFWEYADTLFNNQAGENQGTFNDTNLAKFAQQVGLDMTQYNQCMANNTYLSKVQASTQNGSLRGINSTPTLFIGKTGETGQMVRGAITMQTFESMIAPLLK